MNWQCPNCRRLVVHDYSHLGSQDWLCYPIRANFALTAREPQGV